MRGGGRTPVMVETEKGQVPIDSWAICEFFEETVSKAALLGGLLNGQAQRGALQPIRPHP